MGIKEIKTKTTDVKRRLFRIDYVHTETLLHKGICVVGNIVITSSSGSGYVDVYDGVNAKGEHKAHLRCIVNTTFSTGAAQDHYFDKGIYIVPNAATTHVMITWYPLEFK